MFPISSVVKVIASKKRTSPSRVTPLIAARGISDCVAFTGAEGETKRRGEVQEEEENAGELRRGR